MSNVINSQSTPPRDARPKSPAGAAASSTAPGPAPFYDSEVHLLDRLAVIYRYRAIAASVFVLSTLALLIQGYTAIPMYEAKTRILIEDERSTAIPGLNPENQFYEDPEPYFQTQYRILVGRDLVRKVVTKLKLDTVPEFNAAPAPAGSPLTILSDLRHRLAGTLGRKPAAPAEAPRADELPAESAYVDAFASRLRVDPVRGSHLVDLAFTGMEPKFTATAVNAVAREYVDQNLAVKLQTTTGMLDWLDKEVGHQQKKVQDSEKALAEYRAHQNAMSLDDKQNIVVARLNKLNDDVMFARTKRARSQVLYEQLRASAPAQLAEIASVAQSPVVAAAKGKVIDAQRAKAQLAERYGEKHPAMAKAITDLQEAQRQYELEVGRAVQAIRNDHDTAVLEESSFSQALNAAKADAQDLSNKSVDYNVMERETKSNRQVYESLLQKENELRVASNSHANNVRVVDTAEVPGGPSTAGGRRSWPIAIAFGLVLAVMVPFGLDYINDTVKTPEDVTRRLKLPFLGLVPSVRGDKHPVLASSHGPHDFGASFRSLRTALMANYDTPHTKVVMFTSAQPLEGKTTTAVNIAMALAYGGARGRVGGAAMRRPGLHRPLRLTNERGLSQVLIGQARVRDVIQRTVDPNLLAITAGKAPPNPSELLASERMKMLLNNLSHGPFDWIIIDTPPVLAVTDAVILAPSVDGVTFVVGAEMTRRRLAERAIETIMQTRPRPC